MKVLRYEIKNITPPHDILAAMEKQMRAEREKRAVILTSEGQRDAAINTAEGTKQETIKASEARRQQQINEAEGQASAILAVATATAEGIRRVAEAIADARRHAKAIQLRVAEQYINEFGKVINNADTDHPAGERRRRRRHDHDGDAGDRLRSNRRCAAWRPASAAVTGFDRACPRSLGPASSAAATSASRRPSETPSRSEPSQSAPNSRLAASAPKPSTALYQPNAVPCSVRRREIGDQRLLAALDEREVDAVDEEPREQRQQRLVLTAKPA